MIEINLRPGVRRTAARQAPFAGLVDRIKAGSSAGGSSSGGPDQWMLLAGLAWAVVIGGAGFLFMQTGSRTSELAPQLEEAQAEYSRYQSFIRQKRAAERSRDSVVAQIATISSVDRDRYVWPHLLDEIGAAVPEGTWLTSISNVMTSTGPVLDSLARPTVAVRIDGLTGDLQNLTAFLRRLEASPWVANVLPISAKTKIESNRALTEFTVQAQFEQAPASMVSSVPILQSVVED
jgi:type IV pilus assembly protein PilN